jgi:DNA-binding response OmpR family regulator
MYLVYSHNKSFVDAVKSAVNTDIVWATNSQTAFQKLRETFLIILDAQTDKEGALSFSKDLLNEANDIPPIILSIKRKSDKWLAKKFGAIATISNPINAFELQNAIENFTDL